ncbi:hypothetical protein SAMN05518672_10550 [Chitinophaga sp. CF118]|uniref:hypothetical protein n=1 Tax=Chitinophaga sp. CF118 TaxID=1884367 RepID=UPI0008F23C53|nr:hypothetical protein [Chitinophaga sp. CF118]SFE24895.1 hypothetical protein SAMN05518672_10550 [Chitinophaga sp. CF118]
MPLKTYLLPVLALLLTFTACKKKNSNGDPAPQEEGLVISLENVTEGAYTAAPGSTYTFQVKVTSAMPSKGVTVDITAITDPGGIVIPQNLIAPTTDGTISINLSGLKPLQIVKVTVVITSAGKSNNVVTKSFWITNKEPQ